MGPVDFGGPMRVGCALLVVSVPFALWKLGELLWWLIHLNWSAL